MDQPKPQSANRSTRGFGKDLKVSIQNNQLVVEGERRMPEGFDRSCYTQLMYGRFYSAVSLPAGVDADKIACRLRDGIFGYFDSAGGKLQAAAGSDPKRGIPQSDSFLTALRP